MSKLDWKLAKNVKFKLNCDKFSGVLCLWSVPMTVELLLSAAIIYGSDFNFFFTQCTRSYVNCPIKTLATCDLKLHCLLVIILQSWGAPPPHPTSHCMMSNENASIPIILHQPSITQFVKEVTLLCFMFRKK